MDRKDILNQIFAAGLAAVAPDQAIFHNIHLEGDKLVTSGKTYDLKGKQIFVLGAGKGVAPMAQAVEELLGDRITAGLIIVKYDHDLPLKHIEQAEAGHPVPDLAGVEATERMLAIAEQAKPEDLIIYLLSGGASALTPAPVPGVTLEDIRKTTQLLLDCGADIQEINSLRKHLSIFSGGQLARASAAPILAVIISDVIGDKLDVIGSGPTVPDVSTFKDCEQIIEKYKLSDKLPPAVKSWLERGLQGEVAETPKPGDPCFKLVNNILVGTNRQALEAGAAEARTLGYKPEILSDCISGEARDVAKELIAKARDIEASTKEKICLLAGGETTVTIKGKGKGGRNQEMALAAALEITPGIAALFAGTDGTDGPTDAAGGFAHSQSVENMGGRDAALDLLAANDSYNALSKSGDLLVTGPTRTNVMDLAIILIN